MALAGKKTTLNVLELAGFGNGHTQNSYAGLRRIGFRAINLLSVDIKADRGSYSPQQRPGLELKAIKADAYDFLLKRPFSYEPIIGIENPKYYMEFAPDHVQLNMMTGRRMDKALAENFFAALGHRLREGGLLFFSSDHVIFDGLGQHFDKQDGPFSALSRIISKNFDVLFQFYRENLRALAECGKYEAVPQEKLGDDRRIKPIITPEAKEIAGWFGFQLRSPSDAQKFFMGFSQHVGSYGTYFVIAKKKE